MEISVFKEELKTFEEKLFELLKLPNLYEVEEQLGKWMESRYGDKDVETKNSLDYVFKIIVARITVLFFVLIPQTSADDLTVRINLVEKILDLTFGLAKKDLVDSKLPFGLMSQIFESQPIENCEKFFALLESRVEKFSNPQFVEKTRTILLRMTTDLLKRLSKSNNTVFCGQIMLFLAFLFPLSDRSGLNVKSELNTNNITKWDEKVSISEPSLDTTFYSTFWALQNYFQNPYLALSTSENWETFATNMDNVLQALKASAGAQVASSNGDVNLLKIDETTFSLAKYLTSSKLIQLELKDPIFRRQILVQMLVTLQALQNPISFSTEPSQLFLKEKQKQKAEQLSLLVKENLTKTPPDGQAFTNAVQSLLDREQFWTKWKKEGCKPFEKTIPEGFSFKKRSVFEDEKSEQKSKKLSVGSPELTRLWCLPKNEEFFKSEATKNAIPSLSTFVTTLQDEMTNGIEAEYRVDHNPVYRLRAVRLLAKTYPDQLMKLSKASDWGKELLAIAENPLAQSLKSTKKDDEKMESSSTNSLVTNGASSPTPS